jgi:hypothetical protein
MVVDMHGRGAGQERASQQNTRAAGSGQGIPMGDQAQSHSAAANSGGIGSQISNKASEDNAIIPANLMNLFQQFIDSMGNKEQNSKKGSQEEHQDNGENGKEAMERPAKEMPESSTQGGARGHNLVNAPYCYQCLNHGHPKEKCSVELFCEICESVTHVRGRCPLLKKAKNTYALTCGYVVDGLGFYYIPNSVAVRPKVPAKIAVVRVVEGDMTTLQVKAEMERLVPAKMTWAVEEIEHNRFKTVFSSMGEMQQMIEWGQVQTKDRKAKLIIEELSGDINAKKVMRKVWVQMTRLQSELRDFLIIWAVGTILGVTKDVDMNFTRQFNRPRMQILVLDPALIPISVDVVIGDNVYELHFKVEPEDMQENPKPVDMDEDGDDSQGKEDENGTDHMDFMQEGVVHNPKKQNENQGATHKVLHKQGGGGGKFQPFF